MGENDSDFDRYEHDYLRRVRNKDGEPPMTEYERYKEGIRKKYAEAELVPHDALVLAMMAGGHHFAQLGMGTVRVTKSMLRLHGHGMVIGRTKISFDEREQLQAFTNSPVFRRYADNLAKVSSKDDVLFFKAAAGIMCGGTEGDGDKDVEPYVFDVTDAGRQLLESGGSADYYDKRCQKYTTDALLLYGHPSSGGKLGLGVAVGLGGAVAAGLLTGGMLGSLGA